MKRFGVDTGLEDAMLVLSVNGASYRKLDAKKRSHFSELYSESLLSIIPEYARLAELQFEVVKIDVPPILTEVVIRWRCHGDERDEEIQQVLTAEAESIRRKLSETLYNSNVPRLKFVADRTHLTQEEMNRLFEIADYGMQYRAVSHTAAVLGPAAAGVKQEEAKPDKVPRWLQSRIEMKEARRRAREAALNDERVADTERTTNASNASSHPDFVADKSCS
ncbi:Protein C25G4.3 b [Aphelenchoides avenae]|nr:Protein C25G4.3 b [Aphelenchus avenae]